MALVSQSELESRIGRPLSAEESASFTIINNANQAYIERIIGSSVEVVSATTRFYDGGLQNLEIDPCTDITSVKYVDEYETTDDTLVAPNEYVAEPRNNTLKRWLRSRQGAFWGRMNGLSITAKFSIAGDANTLAIVKDALLASLESEITNTDNIKRESIEGYSVEFAQSTTKNALDKLKLIFPGI